MRVEGEAVSGEGDEVRAEGKVVRSDGETVSLGDGCHCGSLWDLVQDEEELRAGESVRVGGEAVRVVRCDLVRVLVVLQVEDSECVALCLLQ